MPWVGVLKEVRSKLGRSFRHRGMAGTAKAIVINIWKQFIWDTIVIRYPEWRFDRQWGVQTAGILKRPTGTSNPLDLFAEKYEAIPPALFREILHSIHVDLSQFVFCDMGCGKGRALLLASEHPFKAIVGVEFVPELAAVAERNLSACKSKHRCCAGARIVCGDAAEYRFPDGNALIFFYNPFKEAIMRRVLDNIRTSADPSVERYVLYANPVLGSLLESSDLFSLVARGKRYSIYKMLQDASHARSE